MKWLGFNDLSVVNLDKIATIRVSGSEIIAIGDSCASDNYVMYKGSCEQDARDVFYKLRNYLESAGVKIAEFSPEEGLSE